MTPDADWQEKSNTPADTVPEFKEAKSVSRGQRIFILIFFSNPRLDANGRANLNCALDVMRPDGSVSTHQTGMACFQESCRAVHTIPILQPLSSVSWATRTIGRNVDGAGLAQGQFKRYRPASQNIICAQMMGDLP